MAIAIEVPHGHGKRVHSHFHVGRRLEGAIALPQQDRHDADEAYAFIESAGGHGQILAAIAIEVPHGHGKRNSGYAHLRRGDKGAIALAQQDGYGTLRRLTEEIGIRHGQIRVAIAIEVPHGHGHRVHSHPHLGRLDKGAIALAQPNGYGVENRISRGQIQVAIAVEVPHGHGNRPLSYPHLQRLDKGAIASPQQDRHILCGYIQVAIAVEISHGHGASLPSHRKE